MKSQTVQSLLTMGAMFFFVVALVRMNNRLSSMTEALSEHATVINEQSEAINALLKPGQPVRKGGVVR